MKEQMLKRIAERDLTVGVVGLGYVGLPLATAFALKGVRVLGFDTNSEKIAEMKKGRCLVADVRGEDFSSAVASGRLTFSDMPDDLSACEAFILCVPTPLDEYRKPDTSYIRAASTMVGAYLRPGTFVSLESTTYPTTTEHVVCPILEETSGLAAGFDFWVCFSPERVDPGNTHFHTANTPKVIGGINPDSLDVGIRLYSMCVDNMHPVSSPRIAEMVKILENTYRLVNISLINEIALLCTRMDIDIWETIDAAKTKPFGFQAFYPGPGIGGHCIPLDPFYLQHIAKGFKFDLTLIEAAGQINTQMPYRMSIKITYALNLHKKAVNNSRILFLGVSYKPDIDDPRESPALEIMDICHHKGAKVLYHDPHVPRVDTQRGLHLTSRPLTKELLAGVDCVVITTNHRCFDYGFIVEHSPLVVDLRNAVLEKHEKVVRL